MFRQQQFVIISCLSMKLCVSSVLTEEDRSQPAQWDQLRVGLPTSFIIIGQNQNHPIRDVPEYSGWLAPLAQRGRDARSGPSRAEP